MTRLHTDDFERLYRRLDAASASPPPGRATGQPIGGFEPTPLNTGAGSGVASRLANPPATAGPIRELEAELAVALIKYDSTQDLARKNVVSHAELALARGVALVIVARLEGIDDDARDELARLEVELRRKEAELKRAQALEKAAAFPVARNDRLNKRKNNMVSEEDVAKAQAEWEVATAGIGIAEAGVSEVKLRIRQLGERQLRVKRAVAQAERVKKDG